MAAGGGFGTKDHGDFGILLWLNPGGIAMIEIHLRIQEQNPFFRISNKSLALKVLLNHSCFVSQRLRILFLFHRTDEIFCRYTITSSLKKSLANQL